MVNQAFSSPNAGKPCVLGISARLASISFSGIREKGIQKNRASSITILWLYHPDFSHFMRHFKAVGGRFLENQKAGWHKATQISRLGPLKISLPVRFQ